MRTSQDMAVHKESLNQSSMEETHCSSGGALVSAGFLCWQGNF